MKILIVDKNVLFREGLSSLIRAQAIFDEIREANSMNGAIEAAVRMAADVVLLPFDLPDGSGLDAIFQIRFQLPKTRFVILTDYDDRDHLVAAVRSGVKGYLTTDLSSTELIDALRRIAQGEAFLTGGMLDMLLEEYNRKDRANHLPNPDLMQLTAREQDVLYQLAIGASNQEIARQLYLSENTVKNHVHSILAKLKLTNRREVANLTYRVKPGLLPTNSRSF